MLKINFNRSTCEADYKTAFELFKKEMITVHNLKSRRVVTKNKNNLKEKLWRKMENSCAYIRIMLSDVESDVHTEFHSRFFFFNEWLEKYGIMRNQFQEPKLQ